MSNLLKNMKKEAKERNSAPKVVISRQELKNKQREMELRFGSLTMKLVEAFGELQAAGDYLGAFWLSDCCRVLINHACKAMEADESSGFLN